MNQVYDFKRIMLLSRLKFSLHKKALMLSVLGYFALLFVVGFFIAYASRNNPNEIFFFQPFHYVALPIMVFVGSILFAGRSFQDMNTPEKSIAQILIPASTFEKFILPLISTTLLWVVFSLICYQVFSIIFNAAWVVAFGYGFEIFNVLRIFNFSVIFDIILGYFLAHSIFFLGATAFRKYPIVKTLLAQWIVNWAYSLLGIVVILILFGSMEKFGLTMENLGHILGQKEWFNPENIEFKAKLFGRIMMVALTLSFYFTAYFKLKEREV